MRSESSHLPGHLGGPQSSHFYSLRPLGVAPRTDDEGKDMALTRMWRRGVRGR